MRRTDPCPGRDRRPGPSLPGLITLNALLLVLLAAVTFSAPADAQARTRGQYTMVAGGVNGAPAAAVYIADVTNEQLLALTFDPNSNSLRGIGSADLSADAARVVRRR